MLASSNRKIPVIFGLQGTEMTSDEINLFNHYRPSGFILFSRNIASAPQLRALCQTLKEYGGPILIDQEGGRVARIKPPVGQALYPPAEYFQRLYNSAPIDGLNQCYANYAAISSELAGFGIDSGCTPVLDLHFAEADRIIGDRSFGNDIEVICALASKAIEAILDSGCLPIIKHIPGHGRALVDSHLELPHIDATLADLQRSDFAPFKQISAKYGSEIWAMTAHIIYQALDSKLPATISKKAINYIRQEIGFSGKLITDDICMYALHGEVGRQKRLLSDLLKAIRDDQQVTDSQIKLCQELFAIDITSIAKDELISTLEMISRDINGYFASSLARVAKEALAAGCDLVLHCSGALQEMEKICFSLEKTLEL